MPLRAPQLDVNKIQPYPFSSVFNRLQRLEYRGMQNAETVVLHHYFFQQQSF